MVTLRGPILALLLSLVAGPALACTVCIYPPETTFADRLLEADAAVIAREDPSRPFRYAPVEALKGEAGDGAIPLLVDSGTRRRLSVRPDGGMLLLRDGDAWSGAGWVDPTWRALVETILAAGPAWNEAPENRFDFFETLLAAPDDRLRRVAIDELSRAPYGRLRAMARPMPGEEARRALADRNMIPWSGFHVLMLGLSDRAEDHALVRERMERASGQGGGRDLGAWATALMEIDGAAGVAALVGTWLERPGRPIDALRDIVSALAVQAGEGDAALRPSILEALHALPQRRPEIGGSVAAALGALDDFSQASAIERVMLSAARRGDVRIEEPELMAAAIYVGRARLAGTTESGGRGSKALE